MRISNSKANTYRRCPKKYEYRYVQKLRLKKTAIELARGTWCHELLQCHYDGENWEKRHKQLSKRFYSMFEEEREHLGDLPGECGRIMRAYIRNYSVEDQQYRTIDSELNELITLPNGLVLHVVIDLVVEDLNGDLWIWDHKFRKSFGDPLAARMDPQLTLYYWAMEYMGYKPLRGACYNEVRTKAPAIPAKLKSGHLSKRKNIDTDVLTYAQAVKDNGQSLSDYADILRHIGINQKDRFFRRTVIPKDPPQTRREMQELVRTAQQIIADERNGVFPRTRDKSCTWQCDYMDLCFAELHGGDTELMKKMNFRTGREDEDAKRGVEESSR